METRRTTVRMSTGLADRLRRAHYLTKRSQTDIITDALEHWLTNPRRPGCGLRRVGEQMRDTAARVLDDQAST